MGRRQVLRGPLIRRLSLYFLLLGLGPLILTIAMPAWYFSLVNADAVAESLLVVWAAQGVAFLIIVVIGAVITLNKLALPIQELMQGARAIAEGAFSHRVPVRSGDELAALCETFNGMAQAIEMMRDSIEEQRAALQETLAEREREFNVILEIASLANRQTDLTSMIERALLIAQSTLGTDILSLTVLGEKMESISSVTVCGDCPHDQSRTCEHCGDLRIRQSLQMMQKDFIPLVVERQEVICVHDTRMPNIALDHNLAALLDQLKIRKLACKPVISWGRVVAVLILMRYTTEAIPARSITLLDTLVENIAVLIENWHLQNEVRKLAIMEERRRMANELHDSVTQSLFTLSLTAHGLKESLAHVPGVSQQALDMLIGQIKVIQREMRTLINELRPIDLEEDELENALRQHIQSFRQSTNSEAKLTVRGNVRLIPKPAQHNLNRIAQEALSNIGRHANASCVELTLEVTDNVATLTIRDNGTGFDVRAASLRQASSLGLVSMRERAEMLGGALLIRSQPGQSTTIIAQIPLNAETEVHHAE